MYTHKDGIKLRKMHKGDLHPLLSLKEESWWGTHRTIIINPDDQLKWFESLGGNELYMVAEKTIEKMSAKKIGGKGRKAIGVACFTEVDWFARTCNISGSIYKESRKDMDGTVKPAFSAGLDFAFEILNMHRVGAEVSETHVAAQRLEIGHLKFHIEGRRRQAIYKAGRYYDSIQLGILREDWEKTERVIAYEGCCNDNFDHKMADRAREKFNREMVVALESQ